MDPTSVLGKNLQAYLPQRETLVGTPEEIFKETGYFPVFISSIRHVRNKAIPDGLLVKGLNCLTKETILFVVGNLNYTAAIPTRHLGSLVVKSKLLQYSPKFEFQALVFNSDRRIDEEMRFFCFKTQQEWELFYKQMNLLLTQYCKDNCYTYGDHKSTYEGNTVIFMSGVHCTHTLFMKQQTTYQPSDFIFDQKRDSDYLMVANTDIIPWCFREGSFDIETIFNSTNINPDLKCDRFENALLQPIIDVKAKHMELKTKVQGIRPPVVDNISQRLNQITSISLVLANRHITKCDKRRKTMIVLYDGSLNRLPLEPIDTSEHGFEFSDIQFECCKSEFTMLGRFLSLLVENVDTLYVYNARFDVTVIQQRINFYAWGQRTKTCCVIHQKISQEEGLQLLDMWENFLSECPDIYKGKVGIGLETGQYLYQNYLKRIEGLCSRKLQLNQLMGEVSKQNLKYGQSTNNLQNLKCDIFGGTIVDMMLMATQQCYEAVNGTLNSRAKLIIARHRPNKSPTKMQKVKDVSYGLLDEYYHTGGTKLAECLVYNLVDSLLVNRMVRYMNPMVEYVFRQSSTLNNDIACHTRGTGNFSGFIQSVKSVEISRLKARIDINLLVAVGNLHHNLYIPEIIPLRGGWVMTPLTGLSIAGPKMSLEMCLDFGSLYPSNMCDLNISPDTIVDHDKEKTLQDFISFDWSAVPMGFQKSTLVLRVNRDDPMNPTVVRHMSDTTNSLKRLLKERKYHKGLMKNPNPLIRAYHNRLQNEMKICANTHYGVADRTCSVMITTIGQHKIKFVNAELKKLNCGNYSLFPNYGDTDSTMFYNPPDTTEEEIIVSDSDSQQMFEHNEELREHVVKNITSKMTTFIETRFKTVDNFVKSFLNKIEEALLDDMLKKLRLIVNGELYPSFNRDGTWFVHDPISGRDLDITTPYRDGMITVLEFENASSIVCHIAKKMYLCLTHELNNGKLMSTSFKKRGVVGFKSSRFGATELVTKDFVNLIYKGHVIVLTKTIDTYDTKSLQSIQPGENIMYFKEAPKLNDLNFLSNPPSLVPFEVLQVKSHPVPAFKEGSLVSVVLKDSDSNTLQYLHVLFVNGYNMNHLFSITNVFVRQFYYVFIAKFRAYSIATGLIDWGNLVQFNKVEKFKQDFITNRERYGLVLGKEVKIPYVNLVGKKTELYEILGETGKSLTFPTEWIKQDPAIALCRRYPVNLSLDTLLRDYFGGSFKCENTNFSNQVDETRMKPLDCHHIHIKSYIDSMYLNGSSKFLAHVVVSMGLFYGNMYQGGSPVGLSDTINKVVQQVTLTKREIRENITAGKIVFYSIYSNTPPELKIAGTDELYTPHCDNAMRPLSCPISLSKIYYPSPSEIYDAEIPILKKKLIPTLGILLELRPLEQISKKTLMVVPVKIARDLDILPVINLITNETGNATLLGVARSFYILLLMNHITSGAEFEQYPMILDANVLPPPLKTLGPGAMKTWISTIGKTIVDAGADLKPHCMLCASFWESVFINPNCLLDRYYKYSNGLFQLRNKVCC